MFPIEKLRLKQRDEEYRKKINDPLYVLKVRMRTQLAGRTKAYERDIESVLGYTMSQLMRHLESKFTGEMNWREVVRGRIHIDHVVPVSAFPEATKPGELFSLLWSLDNLQPLWAKDNLTKHAKLPDDLPDWFVERYGKAVKPATHSQHRGETK